MPKSEKAITNSEFLNQVEYADTIAIIGMAARFPGAENIHTFWNNIKQGVCSTSFFNAEELAALGVHQNFLQHSAYINAESRIPDIDLFDASFFGYSPREAECMDPQHRIFLEEAWHALEDAGYDPKTAGGAISVYAGAGKPGYLWYNLLLNQELLTLLGEYEIRIGNEKEYLPTRVSYKLGLRGPSVNVQTACSTSLVAVHMACQSLLNYQCDMALAGAVYLNMPQKTGHLYETGGIHSPDGVCRAFDAQAQGTVAGNGVGIVVLKRLEDALTAGDSIRALIRGSAINNDGDLKVGFTAPSIQGQAEVITEALAVAGVSPDTISALEAHGTGTPLGDPIEVAALMQAFAPQTTRRAFCALGSVKTNIGHLDTAAGIAGLLKMVLALQHRQLPPSLHYTHPNPQIDFAASPFFVNTTLRDWQAAESPRRAGVSSFGIGGTNAHLILQEAPAQVSSPSSRHWHLLPLSARTPTALQQASTNLAQCLQDQPDLPLADVAFTLQAGRRSFEYRQVVVATHHADAYQALSERASRPHEPGRHAEDCPVAFLFPGQGSHWTGLGRHCYEQEPHFRAVIDDCAQRLWPELQCDVRTLLFPALPEQPQVDPRWQQTQYVQPMLFVFSYALAQLWQCYGVQPAAMIGHSLGEYVAACLAGVFSLPEALHLVAVRGRLMQAMPHGEMLAVALSADEVAQWLSQEIALAAVNSQQGCVVAGRPEAIEQLGQQLSREGIDHRRLQTQRAFHSPLMEPMQEAFERELRQVRLQAPQRKYISNVTGTWITAEQARDPNYWVRHLREPVQFARGIETLQAGAKWVLLEVGPAQTMMGFVRQHLRAVGEEEKVVLLSSFRRQTGAMEDAQEFLRTLGQVWVAGGNVEWKPFYEHERRQRVPLPTYPFERQRYWIDPPVSKPVTSNPHAINSNDIVYMPMWRQSRPHAFLLTQEKKRWLLFVDTNGVGTSMAKNLESSGHEVITVTIGSQYCKHNDAMYTICPGKRDDYTLLLKEINQLHKLSTRVIHLWSIPHPKRHLLEWEGRKELQECGFYSLFLLLHVFASDIINLEHFWIMTAGIYEITGGETLFPENATLMGPFKSLRQENIHFITHLIDILPLEAEVVAGGGEFLHLLTNEVIGDSTDTFVAYRGRHRWMQVDESVHLPAASSGEWLREGGTYLIVGNIGKMSLAFAECLVQQKRITLQFVCVTNFPARSAWGEWLTSHSDDDPISQKIVRLQRMAQAGATVNIVNGGFDGEELFKDDAFLAEDINGMVYSAEEIVDVDLLLPEQLDPVWRQYIHTHICRLLVLEDLAAKKHIDFCILQSTSLPLSSHDTIIDAAVNSLFDAFVSHHNQVKKDTWLRIHWSYCEQPLQAGEMSVSMEDELSLHPVEQEHYAKVIAYVLSACPLYQVTMPIVLNSSLTYNHMPASDPLNQQQASIVDNQTISNVSLAGRSQLRLASIYTAPLNETEQRIIETLQYMFSIEAIGTSDDFFELGGDSLLGVSVIARLATLFQIELPLQSLFEEPTAAGLAKRIQTLRHEQQIQSNHAIPCAATYDQPFPLSFAQQRLWFLDQLEGESNAAYIIPYASRLLGPLNLSALEQSIQEIVKRHGALRTTFTRIDERPVQCIASHLRVPFYLIDMQLFSATERDTYVEKLVNQMRLSPFHLVSGPLIRVMLLRIAANEHIFVLTVHHIISDGWSLEILIRELTTLYRAFSLGQPSPLPELPVQFADYALWQRQWLQGEVLQKQLEYWKQQLVDAPSLLELPLDHPRPIVQTYHGASYRFELSKELSEDLIVTSRKEGATLFMILLAVFQILLYRYTGQSDVLVGVPIAGRTNADLENLIGFFVNIQVMRTKLHGNARFCDILKQVRSNALEAYNYQNIPFEKLVDELDLVRDLSYNPLFQVMLSLENMPQRIITQQNERLEELQVFSIELINPTAKFDLFLTWHDSERGLVGTLEYNTDLFEANTIQRMVVHLRVLLQGVVEQPEQRIADLPLLTQPELQHLLRECNATQMPYPQEKCLHQLIEEQVERTPDAIVFVCGEQHISYSALNRRANQLGHYLIRQGVGPEVLVGLCVERSLEMVVGLLGILKSGGAYVPLDPSYPAERLAFMIEAAGLSILLTQTAFRNALPSSQARTICLDTIWPLYYSESVLLPDRPVTSENLAYILYTSGSTGRPNGVMITHGALTNFLIAMGQEVVLTHGDVIPAITTLSFDIAALEIYLPLIKGARAIIIPHDVAVNGYRLLEVLSQYEVTVVQATPATWRLLLASGWQGGENLRLLCGGEALTQHLAMELQQRSRLLWNVYGPTETTIWSTSCQLSDRNKKVSLGKPVANTQIYILDSYLNPVPIGVSGELYIGGSGVARGYFNNAVLTVERFIPDMFCSEPGRRLYKTGDRVRYLADGTLEFLGRIDHQVKIRGFRIELEEIETVLNQHDDIAQSVVVAQTSQSNDVQLIGYVVKKTANMVLGSKQIQAFLRERLPHYMIPAIIVSLDTLPLTPNGKLNRRALPLPDRSQMIDEITYIAPETELEGIIAEIWKEVLGVTQVGVNNNFFDLGGHSLLTLIVLNKLQSLVELPLSVVDIFTYPTVRSLAHYVSSSLHHTPPSPFFKEEDKVDKYKSEASNRRKIRRSLNTLMENEER